MNKMWAWKSDSPGAEAGLCYLLSVMSGSSLLGIILSAATCMHLREHIGNKST